MANKKGMNKEAIMKLCSEISKKEGEGIVYSLGNKNGVLNIPRWSTGLPDLDAIIGGGIPKGRTIRPPGADAPGGLILPKQGHSAVSSRRAASTIISTSRILI